ncbi:DUF4198 domain-containing protein [Ponticaulis sp.]|uniref:DUF4198 domain-containing protein n=1 Tax=Ponticaulis sp. TaxID=2020902 RepID=UPI002613B95D|nr:DUF4198 domain-containing protein [Ponticaulis sp.]MDF1680572.1 DUF4198 domain-containing protein [Ponticaulis sp.]
MLGKTALASACLGLAALPASAHDAWMEADRSEAGVTVSFFSGHADDLASYNMHPARLASMTLDSAGMRRSLLEQAADLQPGDTLQLDLSSDEAHMITLTTFRASSQLDAETFLEYAAEEGISSILRDRASSGDINRPGTEVYSRFMKALVLPVDEAACETGFISQPVGHVLEIIPLASPSEGCSDTLSFQLLYLGEPLEGGTLHINRTDAMTEPVKITTDENGIVSFDRPPEGDWYIHAAWAMPVSERAFGADYATSFASLSFVLD